VVIYLAQNLQFRAPVVAGDQITALVTVTKVDPERSRVSLDTVVTKQDGTEVIRGDALVMVDALG
jgi:acyl dehydratase